MPVMPATAYLDYNATVPLKLAVAEAVAEALKLEGNPSSLHRRGQAARHAVEQARSQVAGLIGARASEIIFTSGGSEANNLALSAARASGRRPLISAVEHDSVRRAAGSQASTIAVDENGVVRLEALAAELSRTDGPALVALMLANNETGVIQPVAEAAEIAHAHEALIFCDAIQTPGRLALDVAELGVDMLSLSAHKIGGPMGSGALMVRQGLPLAPQIVGGGQELGRRAGTENLPGIVGFGMAAELAADDLAAVTALAALRDRLEHRLQAVSPDLRIHGGTVARLANTSCFGQTGLVSEVQVMALDLEGICVSAGAACSSGKLAPSHVLAAMGASPAEAASAIRVSLGWQTREEDVDRLFEIWCALRQRVLVGAAERSAA